MGTVLFIVILGFVALLVFLWMSQRSMMYLPSPGPPPPAGTVIVGAEDVAFLTDDGLRLDGWFVPAQAEWERPPTVLVFNGNAGDRSMRAPLAETMRAGGLNVLLFDYRGYAGNPGSPTEDGLLKDGRAAVAYLESREDVEDGRIVLFGESLGSGVAVALAAERSPAALVLRSPFTSMVDEARVHYPFLPVGLLLRDRYPSIDRIGSVRCPVLVIAGEADTIVPPELSRELFDAAAQPKQLLTYPGADHNDFDFSKGELWIDRMLEFLEEVGVRPSTAPDSTDTGPTG